jgi:hypothetical protein
LAAFAGSDPARFASVPEEVTSKIVCGNAAKLYEVEIN